MPSKIIPCIDCEEEKKKIEAGGGMSVISCDPLSEDKDKPKDQQRCKIVWEIDDI